MNIQYDNLTTVNAVKLGQVLSTQTIHINCNEEVDSIIVCSIDSNVFSYQCMVGQATLIGKNNVKLVYQSASGQVLSSSSSIDYSSMVSSPAITATSQMLFDVVVVDYKTNITGNIVTLVATLQITPTVFAQHKCNHLLADEDLFVNTSTVEVVDEVSVEMLDATLSTQLQANSAIDRVIMADAHVSVNNYHVDGDVLTASGDIMVGLMYESNGVIVYDQLKSDYSNEVQCAKHVGQLSVKPLIKSTRIKLDMLEEQLNDVFTIDISAVFRLSSMATQQLQVIGDCYTTQHDLALNKSAVTTTLPCGSVTSRSNIEQTVADISTNGLASYACATSIVTDVKYLDGAVAVEGIISGTLIYDDQDGQHGRIVELPFVEKVDVDYVSDNCYGNAAVAVLNSTCVSSNDGIVVSVAMQIDIDSYHDVVIDLISEAVATGIDMSSRSAIEVSVAKQGETLWQLAKSLHMSEQAILDINPDISNPLAQDTKIVVYNKL